MTIQSLAHFNGQPLSIIDHDGHKWLTAREIGQALGYKQEEASRSINNLYERHKDEFEASDTCVIKLTTQGQAREVRVFSATGCNTLGFFSNTKMAKQFRNWAKKVLAGQALAPDSDRIAKLEAALLRSNPQWAQTVRLRAAGLEGWEIARVLEVSRTKQEHIVREIRNAGLGHLLPATARPPVPQAPLARMQAGVLEG